MLKFATYIREDNKPCNPFLCPNICSYIRSNVVVLTMEMFRLIDDFKFHELSIRKIVVIGDKSENDVHKTLNDDEHVVFIENIKKSITHMSTNYNSFDWWFLGDTLTAEKLIKQGIIMDVYLSKSYEHVKRPYDFVSMMKCFDRSIITDPSNEFVLLSTTKTNYIQMKTMRHYMRRNEEEGAILIAMRKCINEGNRRPNRTGISTLALFGQQFSYFMKERIDPVTKTASYRLPLMTSKKMFVRGVFEELKWFLKAGTDSKDLEKKGVNIWKGNTSKEYLKSINLDHYEEGETGPIYGHQWRHFGSKYIQGKHDYTGEGVDQIQNVINSLENNPFDRRHIISGWAPDKLSEMCLPPCHILYQFLVHEIGGQKYLSLVMYQRSCDVFLGLGFNMCSLGIFLLMMSHRVGMKPHTIHHSIADFHIYETHMEQAGLQASRKPCMFPYIELGCEKKENLEDYNFDDIVIKDYFSHNRITADMVA